MADNNKYVQAQAFTLAGAGAVSNATTITLNSFLQIDGVTPLTMTDFGTKGFFTLEPGSGTREEQGVFTGVTQNSNGTATLTGVSNVLMVAPYTETSGLDMSHPGGVVLIISNTAGFYNRLTAKDDDETIVGLWNFPTSTNTPTIGLSYTAPTTDLQIATKKYVDDVAIAGAPDASATTKGISKLSVAAASPTDPIAVGTNDPRVPTQAENDALVGNNTDQAVGTGNKFVTQTGLIHSAEMYGVSATGNDTYVVTLSPAPTSYTNGMTVRVKADVANTGPATLNVNTLGPIAITKLNDQALTTGDIEANQIFEVTYNSTGPTFQMQSQLATSAPTIDIQTFAASGTWTKPAGALKVLVQAWGAGASGGKGNTANGAGGGGGMYNEYMFNASDLSANETVTIGAGGVAKSVTGVGNSGGDTTFGSHLTAAGGSGGTAGAGADTTGGSGGQLMGNVNAVYGVGASAAVGGAGMFSGAGGGSNNSTNTGFAGGNSYFGGAGGGGSNSTGPSNGAGGTSVLGGGGGAGATNGTATTGTVPSGGGGGNSGTGSSGAGAAGKMIVTTFN